MRSLLKYIIEEKKDKDNKEELSKIRGKILFDIWESPDKKVTKLKDNNKYQKIEYKLMDKDESLYMDFLLGIDDSGIWNLWVGKIGSCSYDDDPYCSLKTKNFTDALLKSLDIIPDFVMKVKNEPDDYIQFYKNK